MRDLLIIKSLWKILESKKIINVKATLKFTSVIVD